MPRSRRNDSRERKQKSVGEGCESLDHVALVLAEGPLGLGLGYLELVGDQVDVLLLDRDLGELAFEGPLLGKLGSLLLT